MSSKDPQSKKLDVAVKVGLFVLMSLAVLKADKAHMDWMDFFVYYMQMVLAAYFAGRAVFLLQR